jgi:hypothetical protein
MNTSGSWEGPSQRCASTMRARCDSALFLRAAPPCAGSLLAARSSANLAAALLDARADAQWPALLQSQALRC